MSEPSVNRVIQPPPPWFPYSKTKAAYHVGDAGRQRLDLPHEEVALPPVPLVLGDRRK